MPKRSARAEVTSARTTVRIMREVAANFAMSIPAVREIRVRRGRTMNYSSQRETVAAFLDQFNFFVDNLGEERLLDATVVEIGPGDSIPLGLLFLGHGVRR